MDFRRAHRDERRRRVLMDDAEIGHEGESASSPCGDGGDSPAVELARRYTEAALSPQQPRIFDLIPTRRWTNLVLLAVLLSVVAGIEALYGYLALGHTRLDVAQLPAIDVSVRGSVATWFSSAMLAVCAVYGLLIYQIRRHRADDYRGRYRMWYWVVPVFVLASIDQVAGIHETVRIALQYVPSIPNYSDAKLVGLGSIALLTGLVGARLVIEMRACRLASLLVVVSLVCLATVAATQVGWLLAARSVFRSMALSTLTLGAHVALLMAVFLYARHVHRDARGLVNGIRGKRQERRRATKRETLARKRSTPPSLDATENAEPASRKGKVHRRAGKILRTDPSHTPAATDRVDGGRSAGGNSRRSSGTPAAEGHRTKRKVKRRVTADAVANKRASEPVSPQKRAAAAPCEPDDDQVDESPRRLSKAERKRLRKQRRRQQ